jgi:hypothetical protein
MVIELGLKEVDLEQPTEVKGSQQGFHGKACLEKRAWGAPDVQDSSNCYREGAQMEQAPGRQKEGD